jgi:thioredoxin 1
MNEILKFGAEWCGPCRALKPVIKELQEEFKDLVEIKEYDVDTEAELTMKYGITSIPALIFLKDGDLVEKINGSRPKNVLQKKIIEIYGQEISTTPSED